MKLHDAIIKLLQGVNGQMTTAEIADALNKNKWYKKKDNSLLTAYQVHGRTKNYPQYFIRTGSFVALKGSTPKSSSTEATIMKNTFFPALRISHLDYELVEKSLMQETGFKSAAHVDSMVPESPGLYCIRINNSLHLPKEYSLHLTERGHNILYIGIATKSLKKRFLNQELRAIGHGTFFRSLGALLGFKPPKGSLLTKANKRNYTFNIADKREIINWINANLLVNWVEFTGNFGELESFLICKYLPLINLDRNPMALQALSACRTECVKIANSD